MYITKKSPKKQYKIKKKIGKGSFGSVFLAKNKSTKKTVAAKKLVIFSMLLFIV